MGEYRKYDFDPMGKVMQGLQIAESIYGFKLKSDEAAALGKQRELEGRKTVAEVEKLEAETTQKKEASKIDSPLSIAVRERARGLKLPVTDEMSAADIKAQFGDLSDYQKLDYQAKLAAPEKANKKTTQVFEEETSLRKEFQGSPIVKASNEVDAAYKKLNKAVQRADAPGDMSAIFAYMKMLDPGSTVREGEYASAQNTAGIPERILTAYNNAIKGEKLSPEQREGFRSSAEGIYATHREQRDQLANQYKSIASQRGLDPGKVTFGLDKVEPTKPVTSSQDPTDIASFRKRLKKDVAVSEAAKNGFKPPTAAKNPPFRGR